MPNNTVLQWTMNEEETEVYKLALLYQQEFIKIFKDTLIRVDYRRNTIPKTGDPRKSYLFRYCWKLKRETRGLIKDLEEYRLYIKANLTIIKVFCGYVGPNIICGEKAWIRWKVWKRRFDEKLADLACLPPPPSVSTTDPKIIREIDRTKKFLFERCDGEPTSEKIQGFANNGFLKMWVMTGKVSQFYLILSPFVQKFCDIKKLAEDCGFDPLLLEGLATQQVKDYFNHEYSYESA